MKHRTATVAASVELDNHEWTRLLSERVQADGAAAVPELALMHGAVAGTIVGFSDDVPLVAYPGQVGTDAVPCRTIIEVTSDSVGRQALLMFEQGDPRRPILVGCFKERTAVPHPTHRSVEVRADGESLTVTAKEQIVLRCGKASITLTRAGKVIVHGEYISQRSMGVVRIKGGCVEIN